MEVLRNAVIELLKTAPGHIKGHWSELDEVVKALAQPEQNKRVCNTCNGTGIVKDLHNWAGGGKRTESCWACHEVSQSDPRPEWMKDDPDVNKALERASQILAQPEQTKTHNLVHEIDLVLTDPDTSLSVGAQRALRYVNKQLQVTAPPSKPEQEPVGNEVKLNIIRWWPDGFAERLDHLWKDLVGFIPNYKLHDLQLLLAKYGFTMKVYEGEASSKCLTDEDTKILEAVRRELSRENRNGDAPGHSHQIPGIWDSDNGDRAGKPCAWCLTWKKFTAIIDREAKLKEFNNGISQ